MPTNNASKPKMPSKIRQAIDAAKQARVLGHLQALTGMQWVAEHRFDGVRRWRFDYASTALKIAIEFEGGVVRKKTDGKAIGHGSASGIDRDMEKYGEANIQGWIVLRCHPPEVRDSKGTLRAVNKWGTPECFDRITRAVEAKKKAP